MATATVDPAIMTAVRSAGAPTRPQQQRRDSVMVRYQEMSPETTLVEFISTSASFHDVKRTTIQQLEWDILKVFPNNIMPANAAAWYMAKRRFYLDSNNENQLLPYLLKNYPRKFTVQGNNVEFLEVYSKDVAKKKMHQMIKQGLLAYFTHKVDEYEVYFFDPYYYESTEPFLANLMDVTNMPSGPGSKLLQTYFAKNKQHFVYKQQSPYLMTISREPMEVRTNMTGIIISMIDNQFGILQFPKARGSGTEKALFSAKSLFRNGWLFEGDPMTLPPMEFDGYRIPSARKSSNGNQFTWYAVLVWCGRKPSPRFCSTKEDLASSPYFQSFQNVGMGKQHSGGGHRMMSYNHNEGMKVGEVITIRKNGAVVSLGKDSKEKAFIPGWPHKNLKHEGPFLITTQGVELAIKDLISFTFDPTQEMSDYKGVGCNVTVMKHAQQKKVDKSLGIFAGVREMESLPPNNADVVHVREFHMSSGFAEHMGMNNNMKMTMKGMKKAANGTKKGKQSPGKKGSRKKSVSKSESEDSKREKKSPKKTSKKVLGNYLRFILEDPVESEDNYDSDDDPSFIAPTFFDPDLDYDEYSDGEVPEEEQELLVKEKDEELDVEDMRKKIEESAKKLMEEYVEAKKNYMGKLAEVKQAKIKFPKLKDHNQNKGEVKEGAEAETKVANGEEKVQASGDGDASETKAAEEPAKAKESGAEDATPAPEKKTEQEPVPAVVEA